jgi:putative FmdB family regulatory protein
MPRYDYECNSCSNVFEVKQGFNDEPVAECPECSSQARRIFTPVPIIFKGSGFYVTDQRSAATPNTAKSPQARETDKPESDKSETDKSESTKADTDKSGTAKAEPTKQESKADASVS